MFDSEAIILALKFRFWHRERRKGGGKPIAKIGMKDHNGKSFEIFFDMKWYDLFLYFSIIFQLDKNGFIVHQHSKKCLRPLNGNPLAGASLELIEQKYGCHKFAFTKMGSIQHIQSRFCLQTVKKVWIVCY